MIGWFIKLNVQTFQPLIIIYMRGNFVYHHWGCTILSIRTTINILTLTCGISHRGGVGFESGPHRVILETLRMKGRTIKGVGCLLDVTEPNIRGRIASLYKRITLWILQMITLKLFIFSDLFFCGTFKVVFPLKFSIRQLIF